MAYTKYSLTPANNTATPPDGAPEGMLPSAVNDTMRDMMAQIRDCGDGIRDGTYTMTAPKITGGTITGSTINNSAIGGTTAAAGAFTTLSATGVTTVQAGTVSLPAITTTGDTNTGIYFPAADTIAFTEGGAESMRIDSSGNVGIGTTSPATQLNLNSTTPPVIRLQTATTSSAMGVDFYYNDAGASRGGLTANLGTGEVRLSAGGSGNSYFQSFYTNASERMRINSSGEVSVGTTNASGSAGVGAKILSTNGGFTFAQVTDKSVNADHLAYNYYSTGAAAYRFYVGAGGTVYATNTTITAISDQRLKENIQDIDVGLNKIIALKPRKFDWREGKGKNIKGDRGWIAQEFEQVFPEMIDEWRDPAPEGEEPYKAVNADLIPVLVKAIQEQQQIINDLKARIETLESK